MEKVKKKCINKPKELREAGGAIPSAESHPVSSITISDSTRDDATKKTKRKKEGMSQLVPMSNLLLLLPLHRGTSLE